MKNGFRGWRILIPAGIFLLGIFPPQVAGTAERDFPKKEITILVGFGAGGARDVLARGAAKTMSKYLGVPVVVVNLTGAGGARALTQLYHSAPDGYTIGLGGTTEIIDQILQKQDYDNKKFSFIGRIQSSPTLILVKSDSPFRTVKDFKSLGKVVRHATFSLTSPSTLASVILAKREGFPIVVIGGFQSSVDTTLSLIRAEAEFTAPHPTAALPYLASGQVRAIMTIHQKRSPDFPDTPTAVEMGHEDLGLMSIDLWLILPPNTPQSVRGLLEDALLKTTRDPEFLAFAKKSKLDIAPLKGEETIKSVFSLFTLFEKYKPDMEKYIKTK